MEYSGNIYRCDACGAAFQWHRNARWWGSIKSWDQDGTRAILIACSKKCADKMDLIGTPKDGKALELMRENLHSAWPTAKPRATRRRRRRSRPPAAQRPSATAPARYPLRRFSQSNSPTISATANATRSSINRSGAAAPLPSIPGTLTPHRPAGEGYSPASSQSALRSSIRRFPMTLSPWHTPHLGLPQSIG